MAGKLARLLLKGETERLDAERDRAIITIVEMYKCEFDNFKNDKEVIHEMTYSEARYIDGVEEGRQEGRKEGMEKGMEKGKITGILEAAKQMLKAGFDAKDISNALNIPESQLVS